MFHDTKGKIETVLKRQDSANTSTNDKTNEEAFEEGDVNEKAALT